MDYQFISLNETRGIATLTLVRPETMNAINCRMVEELLHALDSMVSSGRVRVLVITGAGRGFSSGWDLNAGSEMDGAVADATRTLDTHLNPLAEALAALPMPVICAVNGPAAGAGAALALAGDFVVAARSAYFLQAFVNIGLVPDTGITWSLPRLIGTARAKAMMLLGDKVPAETAERWGMIYKVVDDGALATEAEQLADRLAKGPTLAYALIKEGMRLSAGQSLSETLRIERMHQLRAARTTDAAEGSTAFLEGRRPAFIGK